MLLGTHPLRYVTLTLPVCSDAQSGIGVQARHAGTALAVAITPTIIGSFESNLSEPEAIALVNTFVLAKFSTAKPLLLKALLAKMTEAARKQLGLIEPMLQRKVSSGKPKRETSGTPRPEHRQQFFSSEPDTLPSASPIKSSPNKTAAVSDDETTEKTSASWLDVDLAKEDCAIAYAEPLSADVAASSYAVAMVSWMGDEAARAAFSHDWRARFVYVMYLNCC